MSSSSDPSFEQATHTPAEHLQGIVERVTYHAEDSGYTVARLKAAGAPAPAPVGGGLVSPTRSLRAG